MEGVPSVGSFRRSSASPCSLWSSPQRRRRGRNGDAAALHFDGRVEVVEYLGDEQIAHLVVGKTDVVAKLPIEDRLSGGTTETFTVDRDKLYLFDAQTQQVVPG